MLTKLGKIQASDIEGTLKAFDALDKNRDGRLTDDDMRIARAKRRTLLVGLTPPRSVQELDALVANDDDNDEEDERRAEADEESHAEGSGSGDGRRAHDEGEEEEGEARRRPATSAS